MSIFKGAGNGEQIHKKTDEYGNGNTGGNTGTGAAYGTQTGGDAQGGTLPLSSSGGEYGNKGHGGQGGGGILHRSNSSSSSSSEDDGQGGRRKKSIKEKIKEKLPGGNKPTAGQDAYAPGYGAATTKTTPVEGYGSHGTTATKHDTYRTEPEKKGVVEKIKEKLPGSHQ